MNLALRLLIVIIGTAFRPRLAPDSISRIRGCVLPNDLDLNFHMNNGRYLTVLDLGRIDFLLRIGLAKGFSQKSMAAFDRRRVDSL